MSEKYDEYLREHKENVAKGFKWLAGNLPDLFKDEDFKANCEFQCCFNHDKSKWEEDEYNAYDAYFYGGNKSNKVVEEFNVAWLKHIHRNPHHWQHWVLLNDDPEKGELILDMPEEYIIEMICDWWSFSWKSGNLNEIFSWYDKHRKHIKLSGNTRGKVLAVLLQINEKLNETIEGDNNR